MRLLFAIILTLLLLVQCTQANVASIEVNSAELQPSTACSGQFVEHSLPHITAANVERIGFFYSNGAGLAVNDLDNDGDLDIILGNMLGDNQIFWNNGSLNFDAQTLFNGSTRAVSAVDVDADGNVDIAIAGRNGTIRFWRNEGNRTFVEQRLPGLKALAYAMEWADIDNDGDLDLVTASYDASLQKQMGDNYTQSQQNGVFVNLQDEGRFEAVRLSDEAQALALELADFDADGKLDILVGNDFDMRDAMWLQRAGGWESAELFDQTSMATMSFATGDVDNDGEWELFSADMHPYSDAPEVMAQWQPVMDAMHMEMTADDPQKMENVLQTRSGETFSNQAVDMGIWATGWSWSGKFGDLDQDGMLDFYIVNGMQALDNFSHLPNDELIEENQAFRNVDGGFQLIGDAWNLNSTAGGRSMSMADLDGDGDLDIVVNNLGTESRIYENQLCEGNSLLVSLEWPDSGNRNAIGATLSLEAGDSTYHRTVSESSGYLSGDAPHIHFGFPDNDEPSRLTITWPDGDTSVITQLATGQLVTVSRK